jgi:hypothetical protein
MPPRVKRVERVGCSSRCADSIRYAVLYTSFDQRYGLSSFIHAHMIICSTSVHIFRGSVIVLSHESIQTNSCH